MKRLANCGGFPITTRLSGRDSGYWPSRTLVVVGAAPDMGNRLIGAPRVSSYSAVPMET
jgi:hypothetical protein